MIPNNIVQTFENWKQVLEVIKLSEDKKWNECIDLCNLRLTILKNDYCAFYFRGLSNLKLNYLNESLSDLQEAKKSIKSNKLFYTELQSDTSRLIAWVYRKQRKYDKAITELNYLLNENKKAQEAYILKANILEDLEDFEGALETVNSGLKVLPDNKRLNKLKNHLVYWMTEGKDG